MHKSKTRIKRVLVEFPKNITQKTGLKLRLGLLGLGLGLLHHDINPTIKDKL